MCGVRIIVMVPRISLPGTIGRPRRWQAMANSDDEEKIV
jgi:hypothetical protein